MKVLTHRTPVSTASPFVLDDLKLHLRVDHDVEDAAIQNIGLTAAHEIE